MNRSTDAKARYGRVAKTLARLVAETVLDVVVGEGRMIDCWGTGAYREEQMEMAVAEKEKIVVDMVEAVGRKAEREKSWDYLAVLRIELVVDRSWER